MLTFTFYPGFNRWDADVLELVRSDGKSLREAPDVVVSETTSGQEVPLLSAEFSGALSAGNQAWQRSGRAYSCGFSTIPYLYIVEVGGFELDPRRRKKAPRLPNPAVHFSYLTFSSALSVSVLPVFVPSPGCDWEARERFSGVFGEEELYGLIRAVILSKDSSGALEELGRKALKFVVEIAAGSTSRRATPSFDWRRAHEVLMEGGVGLVESLILQERIAWSKRRAGKVRVTGRVAELMLLASWYAQGLTSSSLPLCLVPGGNRSALAAGVERLFPDLDDDYLGWLRRERPLVICWITGYKPRGDDSRPDRGLVPFARMLVGEDCDLLSVLYGPMPVNHRRLLERGPRELVGNGLWEAIMAASDAVLVDPSYGEVAKYGYLRSQWDTGGDPTEATAMLVRPRPRDFGEHDVDTVVHLLFGSLGGDKVFESFCNPPGGDWSGISLQTVDRRRELRWLSLPRVTGRDSKRPDHVLQLFGVAGGPPVVLAIESKRDAASLRKEGAIGQRLEKYLSDLVRLPASVERGPGIGDPWQELSTEVRWSEFSYVSAVAFLMRNETELVEIGNVSRSDLQIGLVFDQGSGECVVHLLPRTDTAAGVAEFVGSLPLTDIGLSVSLHQ